MRSPFDGHDVPSHAQAAYVPQDNQAAPTPTSPRTQSAVGAAPRNVRARRARQSSTGFSPPLGSATSKALGGPQVRPAGCASGKHTPPPATSLESHGGPSPRPFGSHLATSSHPATPRKGPKRPRVNPYTAESREERKAVRMRLAVAEEANGQLKAASNLRGCEFTVWGVGPGGGLAVSVVDGKAACQVNHCNHRLCPGCAPRRARRMKEQIRKAIESTFGGRIPRIITLTQDDRTGESITAAFHRLMDAFNRLRRMKRWKHYVRGGLVSLEVTRNFEDGHWHTHLHLLVDCEWYPNGHNGQPTELLDDWRAALGTTGMPIGGARIEVAGMRKEHVKGCQSPKDCKCPRKPVEDPLGAGIDEVIKYVAKGIEVTRDFSDGELRDLVAWMRGKRLMRTFGSLYNVKIDDEEEPESEEHGEGEEFFDAGTGEVVTRAQLRWNADAKVQQEGWRHLAQSWLDSRREKTLEGPS